jgi:hypothetical protein
MCWHAVRLIITRSDEVRGGAARNGVAPNMYFSRTASFSVSVVLSKLYSTMATAFLLSNLRF